MKRIYFICIFALFSILLILPLTGCDEKGYYVSEPSFWPINEFVDDKEDIKNHHRFRTDWVDSDWFNEKIPFTVGFLSPQDVDAYIDRFDNLLYDWKTNIEGQSIRPELFYALEAYDDKFFSNYKLVVVVLVEPSGSVFHRIDVNDDGYVSIVRLTPSGGITTDMAGWHIVIEVARNDLFDHLPYVRAYHRHRFSGIGTPAIFSLTSQLEVEYYVNNVYHFPPWVGGHQRRIDAFEKYDDEFFQNYQLIVVTLSEGSGSIRHRVEYVGLDGYVVIIRYQHGNQVTDDMAGWHIIIEVSREVDMSNLRLS